MNKRKRIKITDEDFNQSLNEMAQEGDIIIKYDPEHPDDPIIIMTEQGRRKFREKYLKSD